MAGATPPYLGGHMDFNFEQYMGILTAALTYLITKFPVVTSFVMLMGTLRTINKPLFSVLKSYVMIK
jgi:hypothetical protein